MRCCFRTKLLFVINQSDQHTDGEAKCNSLTVQNCMIIKTSIFFNLYRNKSRIYEQTVGRTEHKNNERYVTIHKYYNYTVSLSTLSRVPLL